VLAAEFLWSRIRPDRLRPELREGDDRDLRGRRFAILFSMLGMAAMAPVSAFQCHMPAKEKAWCPYSVVGAFGEHRCVRLRAAQSAHGAPRPAYLRRERPVGEA
jgi:hypothetical protein